MQKNLFLTGNKGCGKSTIIASALGENLGTAGGFLTVRELGEDGDARAFWLRQPGSDDGQMIIDYSEQPYTMHPEVFETLGVQLVRQAREYDYVVLDEIGGFEILTDSFLDALMELLQSVVPCIGVVKAPGAATRMIQRLGLGALYVQRSEELHRWMQEDENTLLYSCSQFDPEGLRLAQEWASQYCR